MQKIKLMAPFRNFESLQGVLENGCDSIFDASSEAKKSLSGISYKLNKYRLFAY
jgi:hypothetical protein